MWFYIEFKVHSLTSFIKRKTSMGVHGPGFLNQAKLAGATMLQTATRKPPNAFHFRRQVMIIQRFGGGGAEHQFSQWEKGTHVARAFAIGRVEADAVSCLMTKLQAGVLTALEEAVRRRGMIRFISHDCISKGCFNTAFSSGVNTVEHWAEELRNRDDGALAP